MGMRARMVRMWMRMRRNRHGKRKKGHDTRLGTEGKEGVTSEAVM
jgi:hypothetical protein